MHRLKKGNSPRDAETVWSEVGEGLVRRIRRTAAFDVKDEQEDDHRQPQQRADDFDAHHAQNGDDDRCHHPDPHPRSFVLRGEGITVEM